MIWTYDYETLANCFVAVFKNYETKQFRVFVIHEYLKDDSYLLSKFLNELQENNHILLGFNNLAFDGQITQWFLETGIPKAESIYDFVQMELIDNKNPFPPYRPLNFLIHNLDIFKMNHWDNPNKSCSLKWAQFNIDWYNIEEMPIHHSTLIKSLKDLKTIIDYCKNDVNSTEALYDYTNSKGKYVMHENFSLREELSQTYKNYLYSSSEPKMASELFLHFISQELKISKYDLKQLRTPRTLIKVKDVLLPSIKFQTPEFKEVLETYQRMIINVVELKDEDLKNTSKKYQQVITYRNVKSVFGLGGAHSCIKSGIYEADEKYIIKSIDVESFYPNLSIRNKFSPAHLPKIPFCDLYENLFEKRKTYPKGTSLNYLFKIILNCVYGLSMSRHSFLFDPFLTFQITINGQLLLTMLYEELCQSIPESIPLMQNTDGLEIKIPKKYESLFNDICKNWEKSTGLKLEYFEYQKMIIGDVNNYIGIFKNGDIKQKGRFQTKDIDIHRNKSHLVVPKAIYEYFINGVKPEDYIKTNKNIYDYCIGKRLKGSWMFKEFFVDSGELKTKDHKKVLRFVVTKKGSKIMKINPDTKQKNQLVAGKFYQVICNDMSLIKDFDDLDIDFSYYLNKIYSEIYALESGNFEETVKNTIVSNIQLNLF